MNETLPAENVKSRDKLKIILWTILLAGTLDILSAIINTYIRYNLAPDRVLRFIASGIFGDDAFSGGASMILAGIILHYLIAGIWTLLFFMIYPKLRINSKYKIIAGLLYGLMIWPVMNLVVIPLSNTPELSFSVKGFLLGITFLMFFIGLPISLMYHKLYRVNKI